MKIEPGKRYVTRNGGSVGPMIPNPHPQNSETYPWVPQCEPYPNNAYTDDGRYRTDDPTHRLDAVSEVVEPKTPPVVSRGIIERDAYGIAATEALDEVRRAREMFGPMHSMHEGFAVIQEETDEVWDIVKMKQKNRDLGAARKEAIQCAAMWLAFAAEVCDEERGRV